MWGSAPHPGSVARGGPDAPRRFLAGAHVRAVAVTGGSEPVPVSSCRTAWQFPWGSALHPGSVARGGPDAPRRFLAGAHVRAVAVTGGSEPVPGSSCRTAWQFPWGSAPHPGSVARGGPDAPRRFLAGAQVRAVAVTGGPERVHDPRLGPHAVLSPRRTEVATVAAGPRALATMLAGAQHKGASA